MVSGDTTEMEKRAKFIFDLSMFVQTEKTGATKHLLLTLSTQDVNKFRLVVWEAKKVE